MPETLHVIGDSITYYVNRFGGVEQFAAAGIQATLDGDPGDRADTPARYDAWVAACQTKPDVGLYALGCNDIMKETFRDIEDKAYSTLEHAYLMAALHRALAFGAELCGQVGWVDITERTMSGYHNVAARKINAEMRAACAANGWIYVDWNAARGKTTDLIHPTAEGAATWVQAVVAAIG